MVLFAASLVVISRVSPAPNRYVNGNTPVEKPEDRNRIQREETLLKRVAKLENDVQAANDDSTAWMERYHEQCAKNHTQSLKIERTATSLGSRLTYHDLRAQVESSEIKRKSLVAELRDLEHHLLLNKQCANQKQVRMTSKISNLERKGREMLRQGRKHVPNTVQITELKREKAESAILRNSIAQKDRELRAAADKMSQLEETSAQNQALFNKVKQELNEKVIEKSNEIRRSQEKAAKVKSQLEKRSAQNQTSFDKIKRDLEEKLIVKDDEIRKLQGKAADDNTTARAFVSDLEQQLGSRTRDLEGSNAELNHKSAELETLKQKVASLEAREEPTRTEMLAPAPSGLAPAASEGMDLDSPEQMQLETQRRMLEEQREQIRGLEQSKNDLTERVQRLEGSSQSEIEGLKKEITKLKDINNQLKNGDHDMTDAFDVDAQSTERMEELTENFKQTMDMQRRELAGLQRDNERLRAMVGQNQAFARGGGELPDATIARLRKEKADINANLSKAQKLSDNLRRERDQLREAKTKISHANSELTRSQRENVEELKKLKEEKAALVEECTSLRRNVEGLGRPHEENNAEETMEDTVEVNREETGQECSQQDQGSLGLPPQNLTQLPPVNSIQPPPNAIQPPPPNVTQPLPPNAAQPPPNPPQLVQPGPTNDRKRSAPDDEEGEVIEGPEEKRLRR